VDVGLIGHQGSGKTTVFNLLTGADEAISTFGAGRAEAHRGVAHVPDARLDRLAALFHPRKVTPAQMQVVDVPGLARSEEQGPNRFLNDVRGVDALVHVLRAFVNEISGPADPLAEADDMELELGLADLDALERRRQRLTSGKKVTAEARLELQLVERLIPVLEGGGRLQQVQLTPEEDRLIRGYQFLTLKPLVWVVNLSEDEMSGQGFSGQAELERRAEAKGIPLVMMAGRWEMEVGQLDPGERAEFLASLGLAETGISRLARATYRHLGLLSFLTAGEDEVRAWTIPTGTTAKTAAGRIHSDIERGFIRAEVVPFAALDRAGSMAAAREQGWVRMEGKDYIVQDGDIMNFRFNV
jgi:GTP-binding protein YchF